MPKNEFKLPYLHRTQAIHISSIELYTELVRRDTSSRATANSASLGSTGAPCHRQRRPLPSTPTASGPGTRPETGRQLHCAAWSFGSPVSPVGGFSGVMCSSGFPSTVDGREEAGGEARRGLQKMPPRLETSTRPLGGSGDRDFEDPTTVARQDAKVSFSITGSY